MHEESSLEKLLFSIVKGKQLKRQARGFFNVRETSITSVLL